MANKKISQLPRVIASALTDLFVVSQSNGVSLDSKSATLEQIGDAIAGTQTHATLETDDKTLIGAINELNEGGGGGGGHTILDDEGTSLTQRAELQFKGAYSEDNSTDEVTEVNVIRSMTKAEFDLLSNDEKVGIINVTDESGSADRNYSETTLWSGSETPSTSGTQITLSDNISNYDEIVFCVISESNRKSQESFFVSGLSIGETYLEETYPPESVGVFWAYTSDTSIKICRISSSSGNAITYTKVVGIKYGNGTQTFHNYSTAEQIVGTWIDGSTLYERTFELSSMITIGTDWSSTGITLTGADKIVDVVVYRIDTLGEFMVSVSLNTSTKAVSLLTLWNGVELSAGSTITLRYTKATT